jgi:hypothetical protein
MAEHVHRSNVRVERNVNGKRRGYAIGLGIAIVFIFLRAVSSYQEKSIQIGLWSACVFIPVLGYRLNKLNRVWVWKATGVCAALHALLIIILHGYFPFDNVLPIAIITIVEAFKFILIYLRFDPEIDR